MKNFRFLSSSNIPGADKPFVKQVTYKNRTYIIVNPNTVWLYQIGPIGDYVVLNDEQEAVDIIDGL